MTEENSKCVFQNVKYMDIPDGVHLGMHSDTPALLIYKDNILRQMRYADDSIYNLPCPFTQKFIFILNLVTIYLFNLQSK